MKLIMQYLLVLLSASSSYGQEIPERISESDFVIGKSVKITSIELGETRELPIYDSMKSIYIAGGKEGEVMERTALELYNKLNEPKKENTLLYYEFLEDKTHGDALHIVVYSAFEKIFKIKSD